MFNKTIADYQGLEEPYAEMADDRVSAEERLSPFYDLLIERDQLDQADHWMWVAQAPVAELVAWATEIRADEEDAAEDEEPLVYEPAVKLAITLYPEQLQIVDALAHEQHRGKRSPAIQEIIDDYKAQKGVGEMR